MKKISKTTHPISGRIGKNSKKIEIDIITAKQIEMIYTLDLLKVRLLIVILTSSYFIKINLFS